MKTTQLKERCYKCNCKEGLYDCFPLINEKDLRYCLSCKDCGTMFYYGKSEMEVKTFIYDDLDDDLVIEFPELNKYEIKEFNRYRRDCVNCGRTLKQHPGLLQKLNYCKSCCD